MKYGLELHGSAFGGYRLYTYTLGIHVHKYYPHWALKSVNITYTGLFGPSGLYICTHVVTNGSHYWGSCMCLKFEASIRAAWQRFRRCSLMGPFPGNLDIVEHGRRRACAGESRDKVPQTNLKTMLVNSFSLHPKPYTLNPKPQTP